MKKQLSQMTLEELWQLFPIYLTEHKFYWKDWYKAEENNLYKILKNEYIKRISHIGSTAIETIWAKPIIDIMVEFQKKSDMRFIKMLLENSGYLCMSDSENRLSFNKGYTIDGFSEKVFHLHLRYDGDNDELYFRDYLIEHYDIAKQYEKLKLRLWKKYEHNRNAYTENKTNFIKEYTQKAKQIYLYD